MNGLRFFSGDGRGAGYSFIFCLSFLLMVLSFSEHFGSIAYAGIGERNQSSQECNESDYFKNVPADASSSRHHPTTLDGPSMNVQRVPEICDQCDAPGRFLFDSNGTIAAKTRDGRKTATLGTAEASPTIIRVKPGGDDANTGESWELAKRTVTAAIDAAEEGDEVWVAAGTYYEHIKNRVVNTTQAINIALYGGFAGTEMSREERDWTKNETILNGSYSGAVVQLEYASPDFRLDGFTITAGLNDTGSFESGGAVGVVAAAPVITNNFITMNQSVDSGTIDISGCYAAAENGVVERHPLIADNVIKYNFAYGSYGDGGGIQCHNASPTITGNIILYNDAMSCGGGICCWESSSPYIVGNMILGNSAPTMHHEGGWGGGGIFASETDPDGHPVEGALCSPVIANNMIVANGSYSADVVGIRGGGIQVGTVLLGTVTVTNNTIVANNGAGIAWSETSPHLSNNIVAFNTFGLLGHPLNPPPAVLKYNCVYGNALQGRKTDFMNIANPAGTDGNMSVDPRLVNYKTGQFHLLPDSPCINAGATDEIDPEWKDYDGGDRVSGETVDIGADEFDGTLWSDIGRIIHVRTDGDDMNDGLSWESAKKTINAGISIAAGGEVWVASGTYQEIIEIPAFISLYGGFAGSENERSQRAITANPTVIDGNGSGPVVIIIHGGYLVSTLDGFTIQNGARVTAVTGDYGSGILCRLSGPVIAHNTITSNSIGNKDFGSDLGRSGGGGVGLLFSYAVISENSITSNTVYDWTLGCGGGIYCIYSSPIIEKNIIHENDAINGGGIYCENSSQHIIGNVISKNTFDAMTWNTPQEGALSCIHCSDAWIFGNLIEDNTAPTGAGINFFECSNSRIESNVIRNNTAVHPQTGTNGEGAGIFCTTAEENGNDIYIVNNTIVHNTVPDYPAVWFGAALWLVINQPQVTVANNIIAFNSSGINLQESTMISPNLVNNCVFNDTLNYNNLAPGLTDIIEDPKLVDIPGGDFNLQASSPGIDSGDNDAAPLADTDREGNRRIFDGDNNGTAIVDMGAYEYGAPIWIRPGDVNNDGSVDLADVLLCLKSCVGMPVSQPIYRGADTDGDEKIGIGDVVYILQRMSGLRQD